MMDAKLLSLYRASGVGTSRWPLGSRVQVKGKRYRHIEPGVVTAYGPGVLVVHDRTGERRSWWPDELKAA
jgi:hypothetical protein